MAVFVVADNIVSPLGNSTGENFRALAGGQTGIRQHHNTAIHPEPFYASLLLNYTSEENARAYTRFEKMLIHSISSAVEKCQVNITDHATGMIISTTKGNISVLESSRNSEEKLPLHYSARLVAEHFGSPNKPIVVSNACISGLTALITAKRMIEAGRFKHMVVAGADTISAFVFSGFNAFQAISSKPCKPYDANRDGITLGEAAATIVLSADGNGGIRLTGGGGSNDANHISGPSRTGEELNMAIKKAMAEANIGPEQVDFVCAHGTATVYNDEMESKAITLASLQQVPLNSLKGYYGHTLGAAGILESAIVIQSMKSGAILPTLGYEKPGLPAPINVAHAFEKKSLTHCLKTASGFGGCNAAVVFSN